MSSALEGELKRACQDQARLLAELTAFYMPVMTGLAQVVRGRLDFTPNHAVRLAEQALPYLARAGRELRRADDLVERHEQVSGRVPEELDPRVPSPLIRAMSESLLAALTARSGEELAALSLMSTNRLMAEGASPELRRFVQANAPRRKGQPVS